MKKSPADAARRDPCAPTIPEKDIYPLCGSRRLRKLKQLIGQTLIPKLPVTRHVFNHIRWELNASWVALNNVLNPFAIHKIRSVIKRDDLSVNVGCGPCTRKGWVNADLMNIRGMTFRYDCRKKLPFRSESVARIRCEHFFEHLDHLEEAPLFLDSCLACLKKGGVLRIVVPDAGRYLRAYASGDGKAWENLGWDLTRLPADFYTPMDIINHVFRQCEEHRYAYDFETLKLVLRRRGFSRVRQAAFNESADAALADDLPVHKPYSLYVDAVK